MEFCERIHKVWEMIGDKSIFVLATVDGSQPSARTMCGIIYSDCIYFQTDLLMDKASEIEKNSLVAVCIGKIQMQGKCEECGHPLSEENKWFAQRYQEAFSEPFEKYSNLSTERLYKITPITIKLWGHVDATPCIERFDLIEQKYSVRLFEEYNNADE